MYHFAFPSRFVSLATAFAVVGALCFVSPSAAEETGTLRVTFKYKGTPPAVGEINPTKDVAFCGQHEIPDEGLIVNAKNNGLKNVMLYVYTGRGGTKLPKMKLEAATHELANKDCRFQPHVIIAKAGDTIKVTNPDPVGHNANFTFFKNDDANFTVPPNSAEEIKVDKAEPAPVPVACNIHEWMKAYLLVLDHPFAGVSDENGVLEIKGLPVGEELVFRGNHETGSLTKVIVNGKETEWRLGRFEIEIKPGVNDMGTVEIPADAFDE